MEALGSWVEGLDWGLPGLGFSQGTHLVSCSLAALWFILALDARPGGVLRSMLPQHPSNLHSLRLRHGHRGSSQGRLHSRWLCM